MGQVYLCGPLFECSTVESLGWREECKRLLGPENCLSPPDWEHHPNETVLSDSEVQSLVNADLHAIRQCEALIWNCWKPSCGSAMEAWHARHDLGLTVVVIRNGPCPAWVRFVADRVVGSVSEACRLVAARLDLKGAACLK